MCADTTALKLGFQPGFGEDVKPAVNGNKNKSPENATASPRAEQYFQSAHISVRVETWEAGKCSHGFPSFCRTEMCPGLRKSFSRCMWVYLAPFLSSAVRKEQPTLHNFSIMLKFLPGTFCISRGEEGRAWLAE